VLFRRLIVATFVLALGAGAAIAAGAPATAPAAAPSPPASATAPATAPPAAAGDDTDLDNDAPPPPAYPTAQFADEDATSATVTAGGVTATITLEQIPDSDPDNPTPVLHISVGGQEVLRAQGVAGEPDDPPAEASIAEMDPSNKLPEVYFVSGCCSTVVVAESLPNGQWVTVPIGDFGDTGATLEDLDGDGIAEIATEDINFITRFDCTACSTAPRVIYSVSQGKVVDESTLPKFQPAHQAWLKEMVDQIEPTAMWSSPGFLAGWVAEKIRLGQGADAWQQLTQHWDATSDPGEPVCPNGDDPDTCNNQGLKTLKFPDRLKLFLDANGYVF